MPDNGRGGYDVSGRTGRVGVNPLIFGELPPYGVSETRVVVHRLFPLHPRHPAGVDGGRALEGARERDDEITELTAVDIEVKEH